MEDIQETIQRIVNERIIKAPSKIKSTWPSSLAKGNESYIIFGNDKFHAVVFLSKPQMHALKERISKGYDPFPGLIVTGDGVGAAFRFENSKYCVIKSCVVKNGYAISLGANSSIILVDHAQSVETSELGNIEYKIDLGFIISYPMEDAYFDLGESFDELISFFVSEGRATNG